MNIFENPYFGTGLPLDGAPVPSVDAAAVAALLDQCPAHNPTPLTSAPALAAQAGVAALMIKDERSRMGLGSFKALGAAYVIACDAVARGGDLTVALTGRTYVTASAGNHGMSVAAGAAVFGAKAVVHIAETVPQVFAERLTAKGAQVVRAGADYAASMDLALAASKDNGWTLLSDTSWPGYIDPPHRLMEGYLQMAAEACAAMTPPPTHIFLQAGVGGLAGAVAAYARHIWGDAPQIIVVEPEAAPALIASVQAGRVVETTGPDSNMGRLDCKEPSLIALAGLSRDANWFVTITDAQAAGMMDRLTDAGFATTPSGGAGVAASLLAQGQFGLNATSRVLCILSEEPEA